MHPPLREIRAQLQWTQERMARELFVSLKPTAGRKSLAAIRRYPSVSVRTVVPAAPRPDIGVETGAGGVGVV